MSRLLWCRSSGLGLVITIIHGLPIGVKTANMEHMVDNSETFGGSLEDLRAFCAVMELGTISAAARQLGETKGGVSRRLSRLERRLGVSLLARTPRAVSPTEEGTAFFAKARESLRLLDDAAEVAQASRSVPRGHLRVTASIDMGMDVLPEILVRFRRLHPQITVELLLTDAALDLAANRIDLALRATPDELPDMGYRASVLASFRVLLHASPGYLAERGTPSAPGDLVTHDLIVSGAFGSAADLRLTDRRSRTERIALRPSMRSTDYASVLRLAIAGGGIAPIPEPVAARALAAGDLRVVLPGWTVTGARLHALSLGGRDAPARVRVFREFLRGELSRLLGADA
jgi:DNA-binding transcriptional LysR family regulator